MNQHDETRKILELIREDKRKVTNSKKLLIKDSEILYLHALNLTNLNYTLKHKM